MDLQASLIELSPDLDFTAATDSFARTGRAQIVNFLTDSSARRIRDMLERGTAWSLVWTAGQGPPEVIRPEALVALTPDRARAIQAALATAMASGDYAFCYSTYPLVQALLERWAPGGPHEQLLTDLNQPALLDRIRRLTAIPELVKADGQATLYRPGHFLARHNDSEPARGRRVAYVLNLCGDLDGAPWRPEYGGMLQFLTDAGDPDETLLPRFNALNLFAVPQHHHVTSVAAFAPATRYALTGWFRDRI
ncbi:2OG-Fe(II) oxygenase family protein [Sphingomonas sp.]|uniref:2OG-Fe(II) oxygenase n=1 Tax=Sphingomonas sp. TaxID=28214 RepID=UPI00286A9553|nr:2OG-Fe(II) oxygenase family protein [Sphingomonas sp.]